MDQSEDDAVSLAKHTSSPSSLSATHPASHDPPSRALYLPELVHLILACLARPDNARNARVCKTWSETALKIVWKEIDNLQAIFDVLCPLEILGRTETAQFYVSADIDSNSGFSTADPVPRASLGP